MENTITTEICKKCAECCKNTPFVELSGHEIKLLEQVTGLHFDVFTNPKGKVVEEYFLQIQENGDCYFLKKINGSYSCGVYKKRPEICKNYPSKPRQKEACETHRGKVLHNNFG